MADGHIMHDAEAFFAGVEAQNLHPSGDNLYTLVQAHHERPAAQFGKPGDPHTAFGVPTVYPISTLEAPDLELWHH